MLCYILNLLVFLWLCIVALVSKCHMKNVVSMAAIATSFQYHIEATGLLTYRKPGREHLPHVVTSLFISLGTNV